MNKLLKVKPNSTNTHSMLFDPDEEFVKRLNYFDPQNIQKRSLFNLEYKDLSQSQGAVIKKDSALLLYNQMNPHKTTIEELNEISSKLVQSENRKLERLENLYKENEKEKLRKLLQDEIAGVKKEKAKVVSELLDINKTIESNKAGIEVLDNYKNFSAGLVNNTESKMAEFINTKSKKGMNEEDRTKYMQFTEKLQKEYNRRDLERNNLANEMVELDNRRDECKGGLEELNQKLDHLQGQYGQIRQELLYHYHKILSEGRDTRHEGLVWVIRAIWNLDSNVMMSHFPRFLDAKLIEYLFQYCHIDVESQNIKAELDNRRSVLKRRIKRSKTLKKRTMETNHVFKTEQVYKL
jgi:chromosome segregation ATPase